MKKSELKELIKEEIVNILREEDTEKSSTVAAKKIVSPMDDFLKKFETELDEKSKTQNEGLLTVASITLALPAIMGLIARLGKAASNILGKKPTDEEEEKKWFEKLGGMADKLHEWYMIPIKKIVGKFIKDPEKSKKVSNAIFYLIVATFLTISGVTAVNALQSKNLSLSTLEAALSAIKSKEIAAFLTKLAA